MGIPMSIGTGMFKLLHKYPFMCLMFFDVFVEAPILPVIFISIIMSTLVLTSVYSIRKHLLLCEKKSLTFSTIVLLGIN